MIGIQRKIVLLCLILSISMIPMMCEIVEDAEGAVEFSMCRKSRTSLEQDDGGRNARGEEDFCTSYSCETSVKCEMAGCGICGSNNYCLN
ncbi:uncharacterized protein MELLADRAFT_124264 [Melampsora larici-populina 98AG31]|uniref:Secreted protein n=1 Tax=Melampsora larici-populina (strain 98AG31 / pathotype 3-4-7) TaxID=747676 RepID=F4RFG5_MELLP|nr:uncharacterized protein MELLADRAFT_124264 [Melampsora larici-populina 98AG31]EGG08804.1 secreted protein [Melampsora larici-populina 98AG31]